MDRILVDECLSVALVAAARARGHDATHVTWLGKRGLQDWNLMPLIDEQNYIFVTNNRRDFIKAYAAAEVHNGLIIIVPSVRRDNQVRLFHHALDTAETLEELINTLIEVDRDGTVRVLEWSKGSPAADWIEGPPSGSRQDDGP